MKLSLVLRFKQAGAKAEAEGKGEEAEGAKMIPPALDSEWLPYLVWIVPLIFGVVVARCLYTGEINLRGNVVSRDDRPSLYWFAIGFLVIGLLLPSVGLALWP